MSLTSYQTAPPRVGCLVLFIVNDLFDLSVHGGPGGDLLSHALRRSTIGAEGFHGRVRDGIGWFAPRCGHQTVDGRIGGRDQTSGIGNRIRASAPDLDPGFPCSCDCGRFVFVLCIERCFGLVILSQGRGFAAACDGFS